MGVTLHDAGHILGSAMVEFRVRDGGRETLVLFSGDIGQWGKPLIRDPSVFEQADYVVMETTYGDRDHAHGGDVETQLEKIVKETLARGGNLVIPVFAVERAQELIYHFARLVHAGRIPHVDMFLDSPMAVDVTTIFRKHRECFDEETWQLIHVREQPLQFPGLQMAHRVEESKEINERRKPCIIMAPSGMCSAGRIKHHLRLNIGRADSTDPVRRLPGPGNAGPTDSGRPAVRPDSRPGLEGEGTDPPTGRVLGTCRPPGPPALDRAPRSAPAARLPDPRGRRSRAAFRGRDPAAVRLVGVAPRIICKPWSWPRRWAVDTAGRSPGLPGWSPPRGRARHVRSGARNWAILSTPDGRLAADSELRW